jgi:hypothetical protein
MSSWWLGVAGAQTTVVCGGHEHRLHWERGQLRALDHGDPDSERALAALGGEPFACMEILSAWERHSDDLRLLTLGSRGPIDRLGAQDDAMQGAVFSAGPPGRRPPAARQLARAGVIGIGPGGRPGGRMNKADRDQAELTQLIGLDGGLADRLQATVAASWERRIRTGHSQLQRAQPQLQAALHGRAVVALMALHGLSAVDAEVTMSPRDGPRSLSRRDGTVHVELPFAWVVDVGARGLAAIFGRFCLAASSSTGRRWTLTTVGPDLGPPETIVVTLPAAGR